MSKSNETEPILVVTVTRAGVASTKVLFRNLAEKDAGRQLEARCSTIIQLLSQVARSVQVPAPSLPIELPEVAVTHASSQTHHPRS
jgi:hypothetical protein